ncbi:MAG: fibronectin type III domain-containing protein, partial [Deltaproteobacteria bacterium]|nr:fibronectin type III domain-containing protein [Deltaproteobacteria bacterium]
MIRGDVVKSLSGVNIMKLKINIFFMGTILLVQAVMAENLAPATPTLLAVGGVPSAPRSVGVLNGNAQLLVSWLAPVSTGGSPITDYLVKYWKSGATGWTNFVHPV